MGQKVNPIGFRLGVIEGWQSRWYAQRNYKDLLAEDRTLRELVRRRLANAAVSRIEIERVAGANIGVTIHTAKPGIVIGKNGEAVERLRQDLEKAAKKKVRLNIVEIRNPDADATLVARSIAEQLEKRVAFRRAMKQAVQKTMRANAKGIKVICGGRLGGAEIARVEKEVEGSVPLQTLRARIDYGTAEAHTTFGTIGVKVWIYHGDVLPERQRAASDEQAQAAALGERHERGPRGERGARTDRPAGERGPRTERPAGERGSRSDRGPRSDRPTGERGPRGERGARTDRPAGERGPRTERPAGERGSRSDRGPRTDRAAGTGLSNAGPRAERGQRTDRPAGERGPRTEQATTEINAETSAEANASATANAPETAAPTPVVEASQATPTPTETAPAPEAQTPGEQEQ